MRDTSLLDRIAAKVGAHEPRPLPLGSRKAAAVALPILAGSGGLSILFTVRTEDVEHHKGEISFPGGGVDAGDADTLATALREAEEEIGLDPRDVRVLGALDDCASISGYRVTPYVVAIAREDYPFRPARREVSKILTVPLAHLLDPANHREEEGLDPATPIHYFLWESHVIWGLTAAILHRLLTLALDFGGAEAATAAEPPKSPVVFEEFVARDRYAAALLRRFFVWMTAPEGGGLDPLTAGTFAHDADRYLRDFVVDILENPPERSGDGVVRSYLGNWYIIHTLEPSHAEIDRIAGALRLLHRWAAQAGVVSEETARKVEDALRDPSFFHDRLDAFWELTPERIAAWRDVDDYRERIAGKG